MDGVEGAAMTEKSHRPFTQPPVRPGFVPKRKVAHSIALPVYERLKAHAEQTGRPMNEIVSEAVEWCLDQKG